MFTDASLKKGGLLQHRRPDFPEAEIFKMGPGFCLYKLPDRDLRRQNVFKSPDKLYHDVCNRFILQAGKLLCHGPAIVFVINALMIIIISRKYISCLFYWKKIILYL